MKTESEIRDLLRQARLDVEEEAACYDPTAIALVQAETRVETLREVLGE